MTSKCKFSCWTIFVISAVEWLIARIQIKVVKLFIQVMFKGVAKKKKKNTKTNNPGGTKLSFWYRCGGRRAENGGLKNG